MFSRGQRNGNTNDLKNLNTATPANAKEIRRNSVTNPPKCDEKLKQITRNSQKKVAKSIDFNESKPMEVCARSSSADSLRTAGHSRSVSHDSYFDLLQSPLRAVAISPSREFSELGLNFDREEPEMRLFSESESLVSSPRVPREVCAPHGLTKFSFGLFLNNNYFVFFAPTDAITTRNTLPYR